MVATAERQTRNKTDNLTPRREAWLRANGYGDVVDAFKTALALVPRGTPEVGYFSARYTTADLQRFLEKERARVAAIEKALAAR